MGLESSVGMETNVVQDQAAEDRQKHWGQREGPSEAPGRRGSMGGTEEGPEGAAPLAWKPAKAG